MFVFLISQIGYSQNTPQVSVLELGKPIERELVGGQKHEHQIALAANQYAKLTVEQRGIDVVVRLLDADGKAIVEYDADSRSRSEETVELTSQAAGDYHLIIEPRQKSASVGCYEIRLTELRPATASEIAIDQTRKIITEANRLWRAGKYDDALPLAERARAVREKEQGAKHADVAQAVLPLANIYSDKGDYAKAESLYRRVLEIREKSLEPNHLLIAGILNNLAYISRVKGDLAKTESLYRRVLEIREKALGAEHPDVATSLNNIADLYSDVAKVESLEFVSNVVEMIL